MLRDQRMSMTAMRSTVLSRSPTKRRLTASRSLPLPLEPIAEMDRADLVLVGAVDPIISHGNQGDLIWQCGKHVPNGRIRGDERGCVKPLGAVCRDDDPLGPGARPLDNRFTLEIDLGDLERRIPEVEPRWRPARYLTHTDLSGTSAAQRQRLFHRSNHNDARRAVSEGDSGSREGAEYVNNPYRAIPAGSAFEQALNRDFHRGL